MPTLSSAITASASALDVQRARLEVAVSNMANADSTHGPDGQPYRRRDVIMQSVDVPGVTAAPFAQAVKGVAVSQISQDAAPPRLEYDPGHPQANPQGYVAYPNINPVEEMVDMITASRAYEAGITTMTTAVNMAERALGIGR